MVFEKYESRIHIMTDEELEQEWQKETGWRLEKIEHEMAMRFRHLWEKFLKMPDEFWDAYWKKEWFRAKYTYDSVCRIGLFLEISQGMHEKIFGCEEDDGTVVTGMIPKKMENRVMNECILKDRLGHECVVYRVPGEIGFYGAKRTLGTRLMAAEDNPACRAGENT